MMTTKIGLAIGAAKAKTAQKSIVGIVKAKIDELSLVFSDFAPRNPNAVVLAVKAAKPAKTRSVADVVRERIDFFADAKGEPTMKTAPLTVRDLVRGATPSTPAKKANHEPTFDDNVLLRAGEMIAAPTADQAMAALKERLSGRYDADSQPVTVADVIRASSKLAAQNRADVAARINDDSRAPMSAA
jgi:hypothetical protein